MKARRTGSNGWDRRRVRSGRAAALVLVMLLAGGCVVIQREQRVEPPEAPGGPAPEDLPTAGPLPLQPSSDVRLIGSLGWALLAPEVSEAVIEIDSGGDAALSATAIDAMGAALEEHGGKTIRQAGRGTVEAKDEYTMEDLRSLRSAHRETRSENGTVSVYVLVLPGSFQTDGVPGVAFEATSFAVFVDDISSRLPPGANVGSFEAAVVVHELGHLFGLVNGTGEGGDREDKDHPRHAQDEDSVMHWAVESPSLLDVFASGPPRDFTGADRREMERIRQRRP